MLIGEKIKQLRIAAGLTQADLGEHLNVGKATIQKYECNQIQNLKTTHIRKLCALFDKTPNYFIFDEIPQTTTDDETLLQLIQERYGMKIRQIVENCVCMDDKYKNKVLDYSADMSILNRS